MMPDSSLHLNIDLRSAGRPGRDAASTRGARLAPIALLGRLTARWRWAHCLTAPTPSAWQRSGIGAEREPCRWDGARARAAQRDAEPPSHSITRTSAPFDALPDNLVVAILVRTTTHDNFVLWLGRCARVCSQWWQIIQQQRVGYGLAITAMSEALPVTERQQRQTSLQVDGSGRWTMQPLSTEEQTAFECQLRWMPDTPAWTKSARAWTLYIVSLGFKRALEGRWRVAGGSLEGRWRAGLLEFDDPQALFEEQIEVASEDPDSEEAQQWSPEQRRAGALVKRPRFDEDGFTEEGSLLGEQGFCLIAEALQHLRAPMRLSAINLSSVGATASALPPFVAALGNGFAGEGLCHLDLSYNAGIGDAGLVVLAPALPPTLLSLELVDVGCGCREVNGEPVRFCNQGLKAIAEALPRLARLNDIKLGDNLLLTNSNCPGLEGYRTFAEALPFLPVLETLEMDMDGMDDSRVLALVGVLPRCAPTLRSLKIDMDQSIYGRVGPAAQEELYTAWRQHLERETIADVFLD